MRSLPYNPTVFKTIVLLVVVIPLLATGLAIQLLWQHVVHWSDLALLGTMYFLTILGIGVGYHRMLSHRSFIAHPAAKFALLVLGSMGSQGNAIEWAATHVKHHAQADQEGDPHSPLDGFVHAHLGWLFSGGVSIADPQVYCPHLLKDPHVVFVSRTYWLWVVLGLAIPFAIGGWTGLLWGGLVRLFLSHHVTWSVNSICHTFGKREFVTNDQSRNEWIVGLLAFGEGWHNNHHAFPRSAFHGLHWWQFDLNSYVIWTLERLGLAHDVYRIPPASLARRSAHKAPSEASMSSQVEGT
jgi:stearoyl-CoA desaturase (delta-9 desaturase)